MSKEMEALEIIKQALERNEAKKAIHIRQLTYKCPNCNIEQPTLAPNYCYNCGQPLDWREFYE